MASDKVAYNGYRAAMKKIDGAKAASAANGSKDEDSVVGATDAPDSAKKAKATPKAKATKVNKPKSDAIVQAGESGDDADVEGDANTPAVEKNALPTKKNARKAAEEDDEAEPNEASAVAKPAPKRARTKKEPEYDADGNLIKPTRKAPAPKVDENGNPVTPKRKPAAPKVDENGAPIVPKPRVRKPKDTTTTTDGEVNSGTPSPKKPRKTKAQLAAEKAAAEARVAAEKVQEEGLMQKVNSVFEGKTMITTPDVGNNLTSSAAHSFAVVVAKGLVNGINGDVKMEGEVEEDGVVSEEEEDGQPISPVSNEEIQPTQEDYTLSLGEEI